MDEPRIEIVRKLGLGATAQVELGLLVAPWQGRKAGSEVAVKTLLPRLADDPKARAALEQEAQVGMRFRNHSLVQVLHHGVGERGPYLVLQYVPGRTLKEILASDGPLPEPTVRNVGAQLAEALATLHEAGLSHGDVKPDNVRIDEEGRAVLLDLGFARGQAEATPTDAGPGSLAYLSPERAQGHPGSTASDVFALGVVLYELATGRHPFGASASPGDPFTSLAGTGSSTGNLLRRSIEVSGADELLAAITRAHFVRPSHHFPRLSPFLDAALEECLQRRPEARPAARELARWLHKGERSPFWRARIDAGSTQPGREQRHFSPFVSRARELSSLESTLERIRSAPEPHSEIVWLSGPQGIGKWRLAQEFAQRARQSRTPPMYLFARWNEAVESLPGGILMLLLFRWLQLPLGSRPGPREEALLAEVVGPENVPTLLTALDAEKRPELFESIPAALAEWVGSLAARTPTILFLDDVHRAGPVTLAAISILIDHLDESRLLLILGAREDVPPDQPEPFDRLVAHLDQLQGPGSTTFQRLEVGPLSEAAVGELVAELFHRSAPRMRLARTLWNRSRGNPGLLNEILRDLVRRGDARPKSEDDPSLVLTLSPDELPLPRSLDRLIAERFRSLNRAQRSWLERLAVVGGYMEPEFLVRAFPPTKRSEIDRVLSDLVRLGWLVPRRDRYRFDRPALREAVYRSLAPDRRRRLHRAAARGLEHAPDGLRPEEAYQRAFHLRSAGASAELLDAVWELIGKLSTRAPSQQRATLARWGLEALDDLPLDPASVERRLALLEIAADAAGRLGQREEERRLLDRLHDLDIDLQSFPQVGARIYLLHGRYASATGQFGLARGMYQNAVQLAKSAGDDRVLSDALRRLAQVQGQVGELELARTLAREALARAKGNNQKALSYLTIALLDILLDRVDDATRQVKRATETLRRGDELRLGIVAHAYLLRGRIRRVAGRPQQAQRAIQRAIALASRAGERGIEAEARARLGALLLDLDRPSEAEAQLRDALLLAEEIEDRRAETLARIFLAILLWENDDQEGYQAVARATELAQEIGFFRAESVGLSMTARIHVFGQDLDRALEASTRAMELLGRHGAELPDRIVVTGTHCLVLHASGSSSESRAALEVLRERMRSSNKRITERSLRRDQRVYAARLLKAVLSREGPIYPRTSTQEA